MDDVDLRVRLAAFQWLAAKGELHGDVVPRTIVEEGFPFGDTRVRLVGPQGIFKPRILAEVPLSVTTVHGGPYADSWAGGFLRYAYRGRDPAHPDNRGLRLAMQRELPLVYFFGLEPGKYVASFPIYIVGDHPTELFFDVAVDDVNLVSPTRQTTSAIAEERTEIRREYVTALVRRRLHQQAFRFRALEAYRTQCALCRLRHEELLDAAHIIGDALAGGDPVVSNGLALCKLHHAAFDRMFLTVRPDYLIEVRQSILDEEDGPMLLHGLKGMHLQPIVLPRSQVLRPDRDRLEERYSAFLSADVSEGAPRAGNAGVSSR